MVVGRGAQSLGLLLLTLMNENIWIRPSLFDNAHVLELSSFFNLVVSDNYFPLH